MMRRALITLLVLSSVQLYAATCSTTASAGGPGAGGATTLGVNTTGANFFAVVVAGFEGVPYITDSSGNIYQTAPIWGNSNMGSLIIEYAVQPITSPSTTFSVTSSAEGGQYGSIIIFVCSGVATDHPLAAQTGINNAGSGTFHTGSVTPLEAGDLIIAAAGDGAENVGPTTTTINSGFSTPIATMRPDFLASPDVAAFLIAPNTSPVNPLWTIGAGTTWQGAIAVFRDASATPPTHTGANINTFLGWPHDAAYSGDGGPSLAARQYYPGQGVFTSLGLFCFADVNNNVVRCVNRTSHSITQYGVTIAAGNIGTVAGTGTLGYVVNVAPLSAKMAHPVGLAIDSADCMYVADQQNDVVEKFCPTGNFIVVAGGGPGGVNAGGCSTPGESAPNAGYVDGVAATSGLLSCPQGVAVDTAGNIFIADSNNNAVRVVNSGGTRTFNGVSVAAGQIKTVYGTTGAGCTYTGSGVTSTVWTPLGIRVDAAGNVWSAVYGCHQIAKLSASGVPSAYAGTGVAGYFGDGGLATAAQLNGPFDVDVGGDGNLYIADSFNSLIRSVNMATGIITTLAGNYNLYSSPGSYWCNGSGGFGGDSGPANLAGLCQPIAVKYNAGQVYIGDLGNELYRSTFAAGPGSQIAAGVQVTAGVQVR